ncbi:hypothetical protein [Halomonas getboli]|nr:hypothetical protein [Halomonas getboli]
MIDNNATIGSTSAFSSIAMPAGTTAAGIDANNSSKNASAQ